MLAVARSVTAELVDLVLAAECAGCGDRSDRDGLCGGCSGALRAAPAPARPSPAPPGLPPCLSAGAYQAVLRELVLAYKERGERRLALPLGAAMARVVLAGLPGVGRRTPLLLVPVPATAAAVRARHVDHMLALARRAAICLRLEGWAVEVIRPLRALPRADSAHLDAASRAEAARTAFAPHRRRAAALPAAAADALVVVLDDVLTTGATLAAVSGLLARSGAPVAFGAVLAATRRHGDVPHSRPGRSWDSDDGAARKG